MGLEVFFGPRFGVPREALHAIRLVGWLKHCNLSLSHHFPDMMDHFSLRFLHTPTRSDLLAGESV